MRRKEFNPDKCPYTQLLNHKGTAIIYVERKLYQYDPRSRIRVLRGRKSVWTTFPPFANFYPQDMGQSCFNSPFSRAGTVRRMKEYDNGQYTILHIEFHP